MKSSHLSILGSFIGVAAALVAWKTYQGELSPESLADTSPPTRKNDRVSTPGTGSREALTGSPSGRGPFTVHEILSLADNASIESEENLERLKAQSQRRLKQLEDSLFLTPDQSREIYRLVARSSPLFTPGITINGANPPAISPAVATGEVHDLLNPDQQENYVDDLLAEKAWWDDLVVELEAEIDADLTPSSPDSPPSSGEKDQKPFNLFNNLSE